MALRLIATPVVASVLALTFAVAWLKEAVATGRVPERIDETDH